MIIFFIKKYSWWGLNPRFSACKADVITTRPQLQYTYMIKIIIIIIIYDNFSIVIFIYKKYCPRDEFIWMIKYK